MSILADETPALLRICITLAETKRTGQEKICDPDLVAPAGAAASIFSYAFPCTDWLIVTSTQTIVGLGPPRIISASLRVPCPQLQADTDQKEKERLIYLDGSCFDFDFGV